MVSADDSGGADTTSAREFPARFHQRGTADERRDRCRCSIEQILDFSRNCHTEREMGFAIVGAACGHFHELLILHEAGLLVDAFK
jgi:hypothetical protein